MSLGMRKFACVASVLLLVVAVYGVESGWQLGRADDVVAAGLVDEVALDTVPACVPWPGADRDTCERRVPWDWPYLKFANKVPGYTVPNPPPTVREELDDAYRRWSTVPHHVIRGVVVPGSTRCASHESPVLTVGGPGESFRQIPIATDITCFSDVSVREYILGSGPKRVTVVTATRANDHLSPDFETIARDRRYFADAASPVVDALEGYEWIFWLVPPLDPTWGAWASLSYRSVQPNAAVSRWFGRYARDENLYRDRLAPMLEEYEEEVRNARAHYDRLYSGRVGASGDGPLIARDASRAALAEYHSALGLDEASDFVALTPPPARVATDRPVGVTAEMSAYGDIRLSWTAPSVDTVTGYKVVRRVAAAGYISESVIVTYDTKTTATTYADTSAPMMAGDTYIYQVIALNEYGESLPSDLAQVRVSQTVVASCTPWPGSDRDPCERRVPWEWPRLKGHRIAWSIAPAPDPFPTIREAVDEAFESLIDIPHQVVRGIVVPGSTRCGVQIGSAVSRSKLGDEVRWWPDSRDILCFVDVSVREYLVGSGPARITIIRGWRDYEDGRSGYANVPRDDAYFADISSPLVDGLEGYEWIIWLEVPLDPTAETWWSSQQWSVQRRADGSIMAVDSWSGRHRNQEANADRLEIPLDRYSVEIKAARRYYDELYDGRVTASPTAPAMIPTSYRSDLIAYLRAVGTYDVPGFTPQPPPPARIPTDPPVGLKAELGADGGVDLSWSAPSLEITGYKIMRRAAIEARPKAVAITGPTDTTYTDTSAPKLPGAKYIYNVVALNDYGDSVGSNPATVRQPLATVPPCTPWPGSDRDPCERRVYWEWPRLKYAHTSASSWTPDPPHTVQQEVDGAFDSWYSNWLTIPHVVVRGLVVPGSTRCSRHAGRAESRFDSEYEVEHSPYGYHIDCFSDVSVREYIVGSGPKRVTVITGRRGYDERSHVPFNVPRNQAYFADISKPLVEAIEGYEWTLWLTVPFEVTNETWQVRMRRSVQRKDDGTIVAVHWSHHESDLDSEYVDRLDYPLDDYVAGMRSAMEHYHTRYGGKIADLPDAPNFVLKADPGYFRHYLREVGTYGLPGFNPQEPPVARVPPAAPVGLRAEIGANGGVDLSWTNPSVDTVFGYEIERRVADGEFVTIASLYTRSTGTTTYTDTSAPLTAGATYTYRVITRSGSGLVDDSEASDPATVHVPFTVVPPCTPWAGSERDPCERRVPWDQPALKGGLVVYSHIGPDPFPTIRQAVDGAFKRNTELPHQVVRGIVVPGSTRCASQTGRAVSSDDFEGEMTWMPDGSHIRCFVDVSVRHYMVGSGPDRITIQAGWRNNDHLRPDYGTVARDAEYFADMASPMADALEGYEWIFWLEVPLDPTSETWESSLFWSVQRKYDYTKYDDTVVAVDRWSGYHSKQREYVDMLEIPLDRYAVEIKAARRHYDLLYGGRVSASATAPGVIATSDRSALIDYLRSIGTYDVPGFTPQPAPELDGARGP